MKELEKYKQYYINGQGLCEYIGIDTFRGEKTYQFWCPKYKHYLYELDLERIKHD